MSLKGDKATGWGPTKRTVPTTGGDRGRRAIPDAGKGTDYLRSFGPDGSAPPVVKPAREPKVPTRRSEPITRARTGWGPKPGVPRKPAPVDVKASPSVPKTELLKRFVSRRSRNS